LKNRIFLSTRGSLTLEEWQNFKRRVTERAQQDRQQVLRAAAIEWTTSFVVTMAQRSSG
jgi:uncharacterized protein (DUF1778 family)